MQLTDKIKTRLRSIGPGFIIAAVALGPGSITAASKIGATQGYNFLWAILIAGISMAVYTGMSTRFAVLNKESILSVIADKYGRWFSYAIGISSFLASLSFQFGNNLGVGMGMESITGIDVRIWPIIFTILAIVLIFFAQNLYATLEKLMMYIVMIIILAFFVNLIFVKPDLSQTISGFIPSSFSMEYIGELAAIVGTTFVLSSALYQSYLIQKRNWKVEDMETAIWASNAGVFLLALMSVLIIMTAAASLKPMGIQINSAADMAIQLELLLGNYAKYIFAIGFLAASFSSLLVNAVVGGGLLADGLGMGQSMDKKMPKVFTIVILIVGMVIATFIASGLSSPVYSLIIAQSSSMIAVPLIGVGLLLIVNRKDVMGEFKNSIAQNIMAVIGLFLLCVLVYIMYGKLISYFANL
ncbi:divalent metal cation transporter [Kriegella sp. EG-1]|nr:divalent metal cation transporter [Flavobacteriaceae bacterium EG-1]